MSPVESSEGLSSAEAARRLAADGPNALPPAPPTPWWKSALRQLRSPVIYLLLFALGLDLLLWAMGGAHGLPLESAAIAAILTLNTALGVWQEHRADRAMAALEQLAAPRAWVFRDGQRIQVPASQLVVGDLIRLEAGDRVPADGEVVGRAGLLVDESLLTGESVAVDRGMGDQVMGGSLVVRGTARALVRRTGSDSALGQLAGSLGRIEAQATPLERRLDQLGRRVARWMVALALALTVVGVATEGWGELPRVLLLAVALAVAAVPEGLPAAVSMTLALGTRTMARRKAVVRRLSAVEALGSVTVIATDKTGTLTRNMMEVRSLVSADEGRARRAMVLANDAPDDGSVGDPMDLALLQAAREAGLDVGALRAAAPRSAEVSFHSDWCYMAATVQDPEHGGATTWVKGAPETVLARCRLDEDARRHWLGEIERHTSGGLRALGLAWGEGANTDDLNWLGLVLLWDPPREEAAAAVRQSLDAGLRIIVVTGDHPATASAVASAVGLSAKRVVTGAELDACDDAGFAALALSGDVFARVSPEHKLRIVAALQQAGEVVAVTGDGVNDAPALKRADVGVAMGLRGSAVAREAADLILLDDNFATIVTAIEEGRGIYENIQKFIRFLFATNLAEVLVVAIGAIIAVRLGLRDAAGHLLLPLTAVQILWMNLVTDSLPALALAVERNHGLMALGPRAPSSPLLDRPSLRFVAITGSFAAAVALALLMILPAAGFPIARTTTTVFAYLVIGQLFFAFPARRLRLTPETNPWLWGAVLLGSALMVAVIELPGLGALLGCVPLDARAWLAVAAAVTVTVAFAQAYARWLGRGGPAAPTPS